jgi:hypothetical protein
VEKWGEERAGGRLARQCEQASFGVDRGAARVGAADAGGSRGKREREDGRSDRDPAGAGAATNLDGLQRALLDAALSATTTRWATVACGDCGARSRVELPVPDVRSPAHEPGSERSGRSSPGAARRQPRAKDRMRSPPPPGSRRSRERPSEHRWRRPRCECPRPCACCASGNSHHGE